MAVSFEDLALPLQLAVALVTILDRQLVDESVGSGLAQGDLAGSFQVRHLTRNRCTI